MTPEKPNQRGSKKEETIIQIMDFIFSDESIFFDLSASTNHGTIISTDLLYALYPGKPGQLPTTRMVSREEVKNKPYTRILDALLLKELAGVDSWGDEKLMMQTTERLVQESRPLVVIAFGSDGTGHEEIALFAARGMSLQHAIDTVRDNIEARCANNN